MTDSANLADEKGIPKLRCMCCCGMECELPGFIGVRQLDTRRTVHAVDTADSSIKFASSDQGVQ